MAGQNRVRQQERKSRKERRQELGDIALTEDRKKQFENDWNLDWFEPKGLQRDCVESFEKNVFTVLDAPSGCGKTTLSLWLALNMLKNDHTCRQLIFIKNPTETGDDQIGYLSGSETDKLLSHYDTTKRIFWELMSKNKLENDMSKDRIRLTIPNFLLGATFDNAVVIIDESQTMTPRTLKLLTERCGTNTKYLIIGDSGQAYSVKRRQDGFKDLIERITMEHHGVRWSKCEPMMGYVKMTPEDNQRSEGSKFINKLYEDIG